MIHEMKLQPKYYEFIKNGTKRIELRLNDEKGSLIKLGDTIKFLKEPELTEFMEVSVTGLLHYSTFSDLFNDFSVEIMADKSITKDELLTYENILSYYERGKNEMNSHKRKLYENNGA